MKKILLGLMIVSSAVSFANQGVNVYGKFGVDVISRFNKISDEGQTLVKSKGNVDPAIFLEVTKNVTPDFEAGLGLGYIWRGKENFKFEDSEDKATGKFPRYDSVPLYLTGKYNFNLDSEIKPYVKADLGYSFNRGKKYTGSVVDKADNTTENFSDRIKFKNGLYASVGVGLEYRNFVTELAYVHTTAKIKWSDEDETSTRKYNNNALRLTVGYKFNF
ncbi:porin family protein [Fusobacterium simiae]|uniref:Porin family protein n=1 Tax=Fusobacterium simiae TaxID=855 RepID=A0ABT4DEQ7_FUSSI|nr:porin family protein [Fusobacterium simiae]MCY7007077.1 porin family protein [Fusobacterium simiae]